MISKLLAHSAVTLSLACLVSACSQDAPPPPAPAPQGCAALEPGQGIGRYKLGTKLEAASSVTPDAVSGWSRPTAPDAAGTRLRFNDDKVLVEFETPLPACLTVPGSTRKLEKPDPRVLAAALGTCGQMEILEGGNRIECEGVTILSGTIAQESGLAPPTLRFGSSTTPPKPGCAVYFDKGKRFDASGETAATSVKVSDKEPVCVAGQAKPLTVATRPADVKHAGCSEEALIGGTHIRCGEQTFSFAGPTLALDTVKIGAP